MQFTKLFQVLALVGASSAASVSVAYDTGYDDSSRALTAVACSDGANGLITKYGYETQGAIPDFPYIGGAAAVAGWNDPNCGTCWQLTYNGETINVLAIDHSATGFTISLEGLNALTNNDGEAVGRITADAVQVDAAACGL